MDRSHEIWVPKAWKQLSSRYILRPAPFLECALHSRLRGTVPRIVICPWNGHIGDRWSGGCCQARVLRAGLEGDPGGGHSPGSSSFPV